MPREIDNKNNRFIKYNRLFFIMSGQKCKHIVVLVKT